MKKSLIITLVAIYAVAFLVVGFLGRAVKGYDPVIYVEDILVSDPDNGRFMKQGMAANYDYWYTVRTAQDEITVRVKATVYPDLTTYPTVDFDVPADSNYEFTQQEGIFGVIRFHDMKEAEYVVCTFRVVSTDGKKLSKSVGIACLCM